MPGVSFHNVQLDIKLTFNKNEKQIPCVSSSGQGWCSSVSVCVHVCACVCGCVCVCVCVCVWLCVCVRVCGVSHVNSPWAYWLQRAVRYTGFNIMFSLNISPDANVCLLLRDLRRLRERRREREGEKKKKALFWSSH